jgi:predicted nucleotidyltransferase
MLKSQIKTIVSNLKKNYSPEMIILFGSYSDGTFTEDSDLDLLVIKNTNIHPIWRRVQARKACKSPIPMDIIVYTPDEINLLKNNNSLFIADVFKKGKILYEREKKQ